MSCDSMHEHEIMVLRALEALSKKGQKSPSFKDVSTASKLSIDAVRKAVGLLADKDYAKATEKLMGFRTSLTDEGSRFLKVGFPEERLVKKLQKHPQGPLPVLGLKGEEATIGIGWAKKQGAIDIDRSSVSLRHGGRLGETDEQRKMLQWISGHNFVSSAAQDLAKPLLSRSLINELRPEKEHSITLAKKGVEALAKGVRPSYNLTAPVSRSYPAKLHPVRRTADRIRRIFFELGFEEMEGPAVESSFWNFDALFQPQDHPARELADTFYVDGEEPLPKGDVVERVKKAHKRGWKYKWAEAIAKKKLFRTHTTGVSARYLLKSRNRENAKYFCVGRVYRNEVVDYKHLAEFYQVEGIVLWDKATFADLMGLLREFYRKLGFEKIRFRPSYFPYTEPSLEVEVYFEQKKAWLELGGAGVFRPEVSLPLWGKYPVLAWGLSLERPIMLANDIGDIRQFYKNDLDWLRNFKLKQ